MTMKSHHPTEPKAHKALEWEILSLPIGLTAALIKTSAPTLELGLPPAGEKGFTLTFVNYKGDLRIQPGHQESEQTASPGLSLLGRTERPLTFRADDAINFTALTVVIPETWAKLFFDGNPQFHKIEQVLGEGANVITCRLGRRQMSLFSAALAAGQETTPHLLSVQNNVLSLLEY